MTCVKRDPTGCENIALFWLFKLSNRVTGGTYVNVKLRDKVTGSTYANAK